MKSFSKEKGKEKSAHITEKRQQKNSGRMKQQKKIQFLAFRSHDNFPLLSVLYRFGGSLLKFGRAALSSIYNEFEWNSPQVFRWCVCAFAAEFDPGVVCHLELHIPRANYIMRVVRGLHVCVRKRKIDI